VCLAGPCCSVSHQSLDAFVHISSWHCPGPVCRSTHQADTQLGWSTSCGGGSLWLPPKQVGLGFVGPIACRLACAFIEFSRCNREPVCAAVLLPSCCDGQVLGSLSLGQHLRHTLHKPVADDSAMQKRLGLLGLFPPCMCVYMCMLYKVTKPWPSVVVARRCPPRCRPPCQPGSRLY
jgi:hypothetical protein